MFGEQTFAQLRTGFTASVQPESGRIVYAGSDFSHPFQLRFSKEGMDHIVQNRPGSDLAVSQLQELGNRRLLDPHVNNTGV